MAARRAGFVRTTLVGGIVFLIPAVIAVTVLGKALRLIGKISAPIAKRLGVERVAGMAVADLIAIAVLLLICFLAGLLARADFARRGMRILEEKLLWKVPGYAFVKSLASGITESEEDDRLLPVVLCRFDDVSQIGFEMERLPDGRAVVFLPDAPVPWSGSVVVMEPERVELVGTSTVRTARALRRFGVGMAGVLVPEPATAKPATP
jgi:uncharacterized membrane protein